MSVGHAVSSRRELLRSCTVCVRCTCTLPSRRCCSEQLSMKTCAMTDRHESTICGLWTSKRNSGFLITLTQKRSSKLHTRTFTASHSLVVSVHEQIDTCLIVSHISTNRQIDLHVEQHLQHKLTHWPAARCYICYSTVTTGTGTGTGTGGAASSTVLMSPSVLS